jgi:YD repeat-containing protein
MRRYLAGALLLLMVGQSSGLALAHSGGSSIHPFDLARIIAPLQSAITSSLLFAVVTGSGDRYAAMHAPPPVMQRFHSNLNAAELMRAHHALQPRIRTGVRHPVTLPPRSALDPRHPARDPLAMRPSREKRDTLPFLLNSATMNAPSSVSAAANVLEPLHPLAAPSGSHAAHPISPQRRRPINPLTSSSTGTGVEPWWTYTGRDIPGIGDALLNVGTGNFLVSAADVEMPERGIDLTLQRVYNVQSLHDVTGDDGGDPAIFGNRWTNNFDASIVYNHSANTITVYDIDGAACTYTSSGNGTWAPCTGEYATLAPVSGSGGCAYDWTKKNGITYVFYTDGGAGFGFNCPGISQAQHGHLEAIYGRNLNNYVSFTYSYNGSGKTSEDITEIDADHSDGHTLIMKFGLIQNTYNELATVKRPDGVVLQYLYDPSGNLVEVDKPSNNSASSFPNPPQGHIGLPTGDVAETYAYTGTSTMQEACGPRCTAAMWANSGNLTDGSALIFNVNGYLQLTWWQVQGVLNFTPADGTNAVLQPGLQTGSQQWYTASFAYGNSPACSNASNGTTTMCDTDGHGTIWTIDPSFRVTQTQVATGGSGSTTLTTTHTWDNNNNLLSYQDPQEFASATSTDISYDGNGNITQIMKPRVQTSAGSLRPTDTFTYDQYNNLTSACDAVYNAGNGGGCPTTSGSGASVFVYDTANPDPAELFGKVTASYSPTGYATTYTYQYNSSSEPGDFGLPTSIAGTQISELDRNQVTPTQTFVYDEFGNVTAYGNGIGTWKAAYDSLNRLATGTDPDGVTSYTCYFSDDSVQAQQSALQYELDGNAVCGTHSTSYLYDTDGDVTDEFHHFGGTRGATQKWYDGLDRLVDVDVPADVNIDDNHDLLTRYFYDLTQDGALGPNLQVGNSYNFHGYGNLYKTQRYVTVGNNNNPTWNDANGNASDAIDRAIHRYQYTPTTAASGVTPGSNPGPLETWTTNYDENNQAGLLTSAVDPSSVQTTYTYNAVGYPTNKSFSDSTPTESYTYDPDGHLASAGNSVASDTYIYNANGNVTSDTEGTVADPATFTYNYYPNGWRSTLAISDPAASYSVTSSYSYRQDGLRETLALSNHSNPFTWTYTAAGRVSSQSDPATGSGPFSSQYFTNGVTMGPKAEQYDPTTGVLSKLTMPDGLQYKSLTYDAESEPTGFTVGAPPGFNESPNTLVTGVTYGYDVRGELYLTQATGNGSILGNGYVTLEQDQFIFGHEECFSRLNGSFSTGGCVGNGQNWSPGVNLGIDANTGAAFNGPEGIDQSGCKYSQAISYDPNGRQASNIVTQTSTNSCTAVSPFVAGSRTYDAEDHVNADSCTGDYQMTCGGMTYQWGPRGELRMSGQSTLHWDGDNLALTTDPSNDVHLYVEKLARSGSGTLTMYDRDFSGTTVEQHTNSGDTGVLVTPSYAFPLWKYSFAYVTGTYPYSGNLCCLAFTGDPDMPRADGYVAGVLSVQGVRSYDGNLSQWITADAYKGNVDDPMSQWSYQWNGNNPITNIDPRGLDSTSCDTGNAHTDQSSCSNPPPTIADVPSGCDLDCQINRWVQLAEIMQDPLHLSRTPDYISLRGNVALPIPGTRNLIGASGELDKDAYGHWYGGVGGNFGKSATDLSASVTAGWIDPLSTQAATQGQVSSFITGVTVNGTAAFGAAIGGTWNPSPSAFSLEAGVGTPQIGLSLTYSWEFP